MALPKETHGKFFNGDAYIIYCCSEYGEAGGSDVKPRRNESTKLEQHIHFWIGEKASQDEATVAAYKTVELDDLLSGAPIQHREVQGHESHRFKSYFKNGMRIMVRKYTVQLSLLLLVAVMRVLSKIKVKSMKIRSIIHLK